MAGLFVSIELPGFPDTFQPHPTNMITSLLKNDLMAIDHYSDTGIMEVVYGDLYLLPVQVIKEQIMKTMAIISGKEIKKVLYDSSRTTSAATMQESSEIAGYLYEKLSQTGVERVARLQSPNFITDARVRASLRAKEEDLKPAFVYESFTNRQEAIEWLLGWESRQMT